MNQDAAQAITAPVNMDGLSYEAYFKKINQLIGQLRDNWKQEQRVSTLKVAIQLSKLLADSSQLKLYSRKHRMITECLDEFGRLVYERVHSIARPQVRGDRVRDQAHQGRGPGSLSSSNDYDDDYDYYYDYNQGRTVKRGDNSNNKRPAWASATKDERQRQNSNSKHDDEEKASHQLELAKDISRNWFLKVASIRELVPRFYIELAILRACDILFAPDPLLRTTASVTVLESQFYLQSLRRLTKIAWGFGDPIVAMHARLYLSQVASRLLDRQGSKVPSCVTQSCELLSGDLILANLDSCATLVRLLNVEELIESGGGTGPAHQEASSSTSDLVSSSPQASLTMDGLSFELLSNPIANILSLLACKYEDGLYDGDDDDGDAHDDTSQREQPETGGVKTGDMSTSMRRVAGKQLERCVQALLDNMAIGERRDCAYRRNIILGAICKALPSELAPNWGRRLMYELRVGYDQWRHESCGAASGQPVSRAGAARAADSLDHSSDNRQSQASAATHNNNSLLDTTSRLTQAVISSFYTALTNLMIALDGCEQAPPPSPPSPKELATTTTSEPERIIEANDATAADEQSSPATLDPSELLSSAELILNGLIQLQTDQRHRQEDDRLPETTAEAAMVSADYLKCFKAVLTYANHYVNEAALERLLRDYLARFGQQQHHHYRQRRPWAGRSLYERQPAINLLDIIKTIFTSRTSLDEFERILALSSFNQLLDCIRKDEHRFEAAKWILESMRANVKLNYNHHKHHHRHDSNYHHVAHNREKGPAQLGDNCHGSTSAYPRISCRTMISFLLKLFSTLNDTLSPLADHDELEHLGKLVVFYLDLCHLDDIHERFEFYLRCRSCVGNLHLVLEYLIRRILEQPQEHKLVERKRGARQNFLNGCLAYAFSTIPALHDNLPSQLELYQLGCQLALERSSLSLADYYLKQIVAILKSCLVAEQNHHETIAAYDSTPRGLVRANGTDQLGVRSLPVASAAANPARSSTLSKLNTEQSLNQLLDMMLKHQDHIDLRHKMALTELIKSSSSSSSSSSPPFSRSPGLLQRLKHLNCIELVDNDNDNLNDNNESN
uniref:UPF0505 protein CG8202 n=2 Tax=Aceria tosichella TaxID=561515 RepID=A0A6G1SB27_9ACAR